jgi:hydroxymethylpyrimidine pyrophosphatase-like HAD family hydrolase
LSPTNILVLFIQQLNVNEKLNLAQWFIKENDQGLFVFDVLKNHVLNQSQVDREQCQNLLQQMRQSENLFLRYQALGYTVRWKRKRERLQRRRKQISVPNDSSRPDISDINLFELFDVVQS